MSLLMDALKKAEEEKRQAAKRLHEVEMDMRENSAENNSVDEENGAVSEFSLEPRPSTKEHEETKKEKLEGERESSAVDGLSEDVRFENTISGNSSPPKEIDPNDIAAIKGLATESATAPYDETLHGVMLEEEAETDFYEETLSGVPAEQLAKDLGDGQYRLTPVVAKTVFSTGKKNTIKSSLKWSIFAVLGILIAGSYTIFYYFTPVSTNRPSPLIAQGIESSGAEHITEAAPIVRQETGADAGQSQVELVETVIQQQQTVTADEKVIDHQDAVAQLDQQAKTISDIVETADINQTNEIKLDELRSATASINNAVPVDERVTNNLSDLVRSNGNWINDAITEENNAGSIAEEITNNQINTDDSIALSSYPEEIQTDVSLIKISKSKKLKEENVMVNQAFKSYQSGHYDVAKSIYADVLKNDPDNRDAHLGLGAIAINDQDRKSAYAHYVYLLELNPLDTLAMSALIGLSNSADPVKDESAIKLLIQRAGDVPYLYFTLGNLYAKQKRWPNAQQAFFDAYRLDTTNPDYVLNLAISLDQMGQYNTALDYYKSAIVLSEHSSKRFDPVPVNNRISALSKLIESRS